MARRPPARRWLLAGALGGEIVFALDYVWLNIEGHDNWYNQTLNNSAFFLWVLLGGIVAGFIARAARHGVVYVTQGRV
jgi:hypothetical protein